MPRCLGDGGSRWKSGDYKKIGWIPHLSCDLAVQLAPLDDVGGFELLVRLETESYLFKKLTKPGFFSYALGFRLAARMFCLK